MISSIDYGSSWLPFMMVKLVEYKWVGVAIAGAISAVLMVWNRKLILKEQAIKDQALVFKIYKKGLKSVLCRLNPFLFMDATLPTFVISVILIGQGYDVL
ncbi:hypothetical protein MX850_05905 [Erysipelothrix sp. Poltava]|nr:hypothetical protein MX850_05905 [Erysipelothrix sp. Poltava]